jgi:hypothetical protein
MIQKKIIWIMMYLSAIIADKNRIESVCGTIHPQYMADPLHAEGDSLRGDF